MAGRDNIPGEYAGGHEDTRDGVKYLSRISRGKLTTPANTIGKAQFDSLDFISAREATVPVLWMTNKGRQSAWGRYMPVGGEDVHVAYRNDNTPVIVGYDANRPGAGESQEGWPALKKLFDEQAVGYASFKDLKPGEYDFKSSGDAYIHGSNQGTLSLFGGQAFIRIDKQNYKIDSKAATYLYTADATSQQRFGTVYRKVTPLSDKETPISLGTLKEFLVDLNVPVPATGLPSLQSVARIHFGNVINDTTLLPEISPTLNAVRARISLGDVTNLKEIFSLTIDANGDVDVKQKSIAAGANKLSWAVGNTSIVVNGLLGQFAVSQTGVSSVAIAIGDHLQTLWNLLKAKLDGSDGHTHIAPGSGGITSTPSVPIGAPAYDININSVKATIPDNLL